MNFFPTPTEWMEVGSIQVTVEFVPPLEEQLDVDEDSAYSIY